MVYVVNKIAEQLKLLTIKKDNKNVPDDHANNDLVLN